MRFPASLIVTTLFLTACGGSGGVGSSANNSSSVASSQASISSSQSSDTANQSSASSTDPERSGLDERPVNEHCLAGESPASGGGVALERVYPGLSFNQPVALLQAPLDDSRWFVLEQSGRIIVFDKDPEVTEVDEFADLRDRVDNSAGSGESGLLSMAFHPDYADNGDVFLYYQVSRDTGEPVQDDCCVNQLVRYRVNDQGTALDPDSAEVLLSFPAPYENHFGGHLAFDEAGYLYLSIGDGGSAGDPQDRAQNTANLWGSVIRIDVDGEAPYSIPEDNPFADQAAFLCDSNEQMQDKQASGGDCPELYAWGLRNPWRWSFDRATGDLWLADVGQGEWEEVNRIRRGGNYGWNIREGAHCYNADDCETGGLIDPVAEVPQPEFRSITGGVVYRGEAVPSLRGRYLFGDYITGRFYALTDETGEDGLREIEHLDEQTGLNIASFAQDLAGEVYLVDYNGGLYQVVPSDDNEGEPLPQRLSETGCVDPDDPREPAEGLIPYTVKAPFWSDGADKQRWLALPEGETIEIDSEQDWELPPGSVVVKNFYLADALIETRLFMHHTDERWEGYTYAWNEDGTDAERVDGGLVVERQGQNWIYPSGSQCLECHTRAAGRTLGLESAQLNGEFTYPSTGREGHQLDTLHTIGVLAQAPARPELADPYEEAADLEDRARAYLHTNCAQCHRPDGPTNLDMDLRHTTALADMNVCDVELQSGADDSQLRRLVPGDADLSALVARMTLRNHADQMPPIGSNRVDEEGEALLREWIDGLSTGDCGF